MAIKDDLLKAVSVVYFLRIRVDRLEWLSTEDLNVRSTLKSSNISVVVPPEITLEGKLSYKSRYRTWRAIMIVMQQKQTGYIEVVQNVFHSVGLPWNDADKMAALMAKLFNRRSSDVKLSAVDVKWEDENDLIRICEKRSINDAEELKAVQALYRLKL